MQGRLLGFKAVVGQNHFGTRKNIRQIAPIRDTNNCEDSKFRIDDNYYPIPSSLSYTVNSEQATIYVMLLELVTGYE